jgi:hypothetical protein
MAPNSDRASLSCEMAVQKDRHHSHKNLQYVDPIVITNKKYIAIIQSLEDSVTFYHDFLVLFCYNCSNTKKCGLECQGTMQSDIIFRSIFMNSSRLL